jgi:hypothetical protein
LGLFSKTVSVVFVDEPTGTILATSEVPLDQLPDTFAVDTNLEMSGVPFVVVRAQPQTKTEFSRTKRLTVTLRKVEQLDPKQILFSLPSICGAALPGTAQANDFGDIIVLHEDDWRQCEFVANSLHDAIDADLSGVRRIHLEAAVKVGWREIHVREKIQEPLPPGIRWAKAADLLGDFVRIDAVAFGNKANSVRGAVAARLDGQVVVWGIEEARGLTALCVENLDGATETTVAALKRVADGLSLGLVHWCRCQVYSSSGSAMKNATGTPWGTST